jgi:hypothetical protein
LWIKPEHIDGMTEPLWLRFRLSRPAHNDESNDNTHREVAGHPPPL